MMTLGLYADDEQYITHYADGGDDHDGGDDDEDGADGDGEDGADDDDDDGADGGDDDDHYMMTGGLAAWLVTP